MQKRCFQDAIPCSVCGEGIEKAEFHREIERHIACVDDWASMPWPWTWGNAIGAMRKTWRDLRRWGATAEAARVAEIGRAFVAARARWPEGAAETAASINVWRQESNDLWHQVMWARGREGAAEALAQWKRERAAEKAGD